MVETAFELAIERWLKSWQRRVMARKGGILDNEKSIKETWKCV